MRPSGEDILHVLVSLALWDKLMSCDGQQNRAPKLRILMLIPQLGFGGAESAFLRLANYLSKEAEVTIGVMDHPYNQPSCFEINWTRLPVVRLGGKTSTIGGRMGKVQRWWEMRRQLRELKQSNEITISFLSGMNLLNALTGLRGKTIVSERGSKRYDPGMTPRRRQIWTRVIDPFIYWRADCVVAASKGLAHEIVTANPWVATRLLAIEGTVDAETLVDIADFPVEQDLIPLAEQETIVTFGRLHITKGYDVLIEAFAKVLSNRPLARLLIVGDGPERDALRLQAESFGMSVSSSGAEADVILLGFRTDPLRYLQLGRLFALPSRIEGLPNALIEALATGSHILASDCCWGPRTILSADELSYDVAPPRLPISLPHGMLMPRPDSFGAVDVWANEMDRVLAKPPSLRQDRAVRLATISRYDIARTGPLWLDLVRSMAWEKAPQ